MKVRGKFGRTENPKWLLADLRKKSYPTVPKTVLYRDVGIGL
jgi:hypothetical protein